MRTCLWTAALAASFLALSLVISAAPAQAPGGQQFGAAPQTSAAPGGVALLDITYLFKHLNRMEAMMAELKADVEQADQNVKRDKETMRAMVDRLKELKPGSPEYKDTEEQIAKRNADFQVQVQLKQREFLQREAKVYFSIYMEVLQEVEYFATSNNIGMVLRFNGDPADKDNPEDVLRFINKPVIYSAPPLDITPQILESMNRRSAGMSAPADNRARAQAGVPYPQR